MWVVHGVELCLMLVVQCACGTFVEVIPTDNVWTKISPALSTGGFPGVRKGTTYTSSIGSLSPVPHIPHVISHSSQRQDTGQVIIPGRSQGGIPITDFAPIADVNSHLQNGRQIGEALVPHTVTVRKQISPLGPIPNLISVLPQGGRNRQIAVPNIIPGGTLLTGHLNPFTTITQGGGISGIIGAGQIKNNLTPESSGVYNPIYLKEISKAPKVQSRYRKAKHEKKTQKDLKPSPENLKPKAKYKKSTAEHQKLKPKHHKPTSKYLKSKPKNQKANGNYPKKPDQKYPKKTSISRKSSSITKTTHLNPDRKYPKKSSISGKSSSRTKTTQLNPDRKYPKKTSISGKSSLRTKTTHLNPDRKYPKKTSISGKTSSRTRTTHLNPDRKYHKKTLISGISSTRSKTTHLKPNSKYPRKTSISGKSSSRSKTTHLIPDRKYPKQTSISRISSTRTRTTHLNPDRKYPKETSISRKSSTKTKTSISRYPENPKIDVITTTVRTTSGANKQVLDSKNKNHKTSKYGDLIAYLKQRIKEKKMKEKNRRHDNISTRKHKYDTLNKISVTGVRGHERTVYPRKNGHTISKNEKLKAHLKRKIAEKKVKATVRRQKYLAKKDQKHDFLDKVTGKNNFGRTRKLYPRKNHFETSTYDRLKAYLVQRIAEKKFENKVRNQFKVGKTKPKYDVLNKHTGRLSSKTSKYDKLQRYLKQRIAERKFENKVRNQIKVGKTNPKYDVLNKHKGRLSKTSKYDKLQRYLKQRIAERKFENKVRNQIKVGKTKPKYDVLNKHTGRLSKTSKYDRLQRYLKQRIAEKKTKNNRKKYLVDKKPSYDVSNLKRLLGDFGVGKSAGKRTAAIYSQHRTTFPRKSGQVKQTNSYVSKLY